MAVTHHVQRVNGWNKKQRPKAVPASLNDARNAATKRQEAVPCLVPRRIARRETCSSHHRRLSRSGKNVGSNESTSLRARREGAHRGPFVLQCSSLAELQPRPCPRATQRGQKFGAARFLRFSKAECGAAETARPPGQKAIRPVNVFAGPRQSEPVKNDDGSDDGKEHAKARSRKLQRPRGIHSTPAPRLCHSKARLAMLSASACTFPLGGCHQRTAIVRR